MRESKVLLLLLLIGAGFFADLLWSGRCLVPAGFLYQYEPWRSAYPHFQGEPAQSFDLLFQGYPWAHYFRETLLRGEWPFWNPHQYLGSPFFANPQTALLFPLTWLHLLVSPPHSFTLLFVGKLWLALLGMYAFLRAQPLPKTAALCGAFMYALSMHQLASLHLPYSNVQVLFPWAAWAVHRFLRQPSRQNWLLLTPLLAMLVLAGQPQAAAVSWLALALQGLLCRAAGAARIRLAAAFLLAAGLSAPQWIPAWEYFRESMASLEPRIFRSGLPYHPGNLLNFLVPGFFGSPLQGNFWGFPAFPYTAFYSSSASLLLLAAGLGAGRWHRRLLFPLLGGGAALALLLGLPPLEWLLELPPFNQVRRGRFVFLLLFSVALLAARGWEVIRYARRSIWPLLLWGTALALVGWVGGVIAYRQELTALQQWNWLLQRSLHSGLFLLAGLVLSLRFAGRERALRLFPLLLLADLAWVGYPLNPRGDPRALYPPLPAWTEVLREGAFTAPSNVLPPNAATVYGLRDLRGYDVMTPRNLFRYLKQIDPRLGDALSPLKRLDRTRIHEQTLMLRAFDRFLEGASPELLRHLRENSYWSTAFELKRPGLPFDLLPLACFWNPASPLPAPWRAFSPEKGQALCLHPEPRRLRLFARWRWVSDPLEELVRNGDPEVVLLDRKPPQAQNAGEKGPFSYRLLDEGANFRRYALELSRGGMVVESSRFARGWEVKVDGEPAELAQAFGLFPAFYVPAGSHQVELRYRPPGLRWGLGAALLSLLLLLALSRQPPRSL